MSNLTLYLYIYSKNRDLERERERERDRKRGIERDIYRSSFVFCFQVIIALAKERCDVRW